MSEDEKAVQPSEAEDAGQKRSLDATAIELATGLSLKDVEALGNDASPEKRASIAVRFTREFDRIAKDQPGRLASDLLEMFSKDQDSAVRARFAECISTSPNLPPEIAQRLARDEIDVAGPILRHSPVLDDDVIADIVRSMTEPYALAIAERRPLSSALVEVLVQDRGTRRVVARILDNEEADLSDDVLISLRDWGRSDPDIASRLGRRPNLPFAFVDQSVAELANQVQWRSLGKRTMTRFEATQLQTRFEGKDGQRYASRGARFGRLQRALTAAFERGELLPSTLLTFLRDRDVDSLECGFAVITGLDIKWVRKLLYGNDRRGLVALCLKADFSTPDYLTFRMALSLAELGTVRDESSQRYSKKNMKYACDQFEEMRAKPDQLKRWLPAGTV